MLHRYKIFSLLLIALLNYSGNVFAQSVTYDFTGLVNGSALSGAFLGQTVSIGEQVTGTFTIDYSAPLSMFGSSTGSLGSQWNYQQYFGANYYNPLPVSYLFSSTLKIGGITYSNNFISTASGNAQIFGSTPTSSQPESFVGGWNGVCSCFSNSAEAISLGIVLSSSNNSTPIFNSNGLPNSGLAFTNGVNGNGMLNLSASSPNSFGLNITSSQVTYSLTSLTLAPVPEPSEYALMLGGLGLVGFIASRRKKKEDSMPFNA